MLIKKCGISNSYRYHVLLKEQQNSPERWFLCCWCIKEWQLYYWAIWRLSSGIPGPRFSIFCWLLYNTPSWKCCVSFNAVQKSFQKNHVRSCLQIGRKSQSLEYGQIEIFFRAPVGSRTLCGAVLKPLSRASQSICKQHEVLGRPVSHIIALHHPHRHLFVIVPLESIIDVCVYMAFSDS